MPFCPKCRAEYLEEVETCPDCQVSLVQELPPEDRVDYVDLVELQRVPNEISGIMMKGILDNSGINAVLRAAKIPWSWYSKYMVYILLGQASGTKRRIGEKP